MKPEKRPVINYFHLLGLVFLRTISKLLKRDDTYHRERAKHIKETGLFDPAYYLAQNSDVADSKTDPLLHYVMYGDQEGRRPSIFFDPKIYRAHANTFRFKFIEINSLLHYFAVGRHYKISTSEWIDIAYYLSNNRDVKLNGIEPITHYVKYGGFEGRSPNTNFDSRFYLISNPDVQASGLNPLIHYALHGKTEGRQPSPIIDLFKDSRHSATQYSQHRTLVVDEIRPVAKKTDPALIDVIIPVYENSILTLQCIASVLQTKNNVAFELIVINDASPNEAINRDLSIMAQKQWLTLLHNDVNKGFVYSVNKGLSLHPDREVIVLNSDTEVYDFWLDRLYEAAYSQPKVASVTPLSNNATICSYPRFLYDNPYPPELSYAELDGIAASVNKGLAVPAPTGIGFCMFMRRTVIDKSGEFDEETFGKGYGEENDWCQRALNNGFINLLTPNIFVRHIGNASFKEEKNNRINKAIIKLSNKYPNYKKDIETFIKMDSLSPARKRLDWARLERQRRTKNIMIFSHQRGGGTERHIQEIENAMRAADSNVFFIRPGRTDKSHVQLQHNHCSELINISDIDLSDHTQFISVVKRLDISEIHVHSLVDFHSATCTHLTSICKILNIPLHISIHDYTVLCPRINLITETGMYCGEPNEKNCDNCLNKRGNEFDVKSITLWRQNSYEMLSYASSIAVPNADCNERIHKYFPDLKISIRPHHPEIHKKTNDLVNLNKSVKLRIVVIGAISQMKGFDILLACATEAKNKQLPIEFILMGYSMNDTALRQQNVIILGKYDDRHAENCLLDINPDLVWLPSIWPETFSYTLSIALTAGFPVAAFDIGAIANRLRALKLDDNLMPLVLANQPIFLNQQFLNYRERQYV